jgi:hypothetical protein
VPRRAEKFGPMTALEILSLLKWPQKHIAKT